jgi:hypothetical protein
LARTYAEVSGRATSSYRVIIFLPRAAYFKKTANILALDPSTMKNKEDVMGKGILLWLLGVPIPIIILLYLIF